MDYCSGAFLLTPRELWNQMGGFDEIQTAYYEDRLLHASLGTRPARGADLTPFSFTTNSQVPPPLQKQRISNAHQALFLDRHRDPSRNIFRRPSATLPARMRAQETNSFIDDRVPHTWCGSSYPRANDTGMLEQGFCHVLIPYLFVNEEWSVFTPIFLAKSK